MIEQVVQDFFELSHLRLLGTQGTASHQATLARCKEERAPKHSESHYMILSKYGVPFHKICWHKLDKHKEGACKMG